MCVLNLHTRISYISLCFVVVVGDFNMRILHTNDVHAHVEQFDVHTSLCSSDDADNNRCYGGVARRQSAVDTMRRNHDNVVLLDAGDEFQGTIWYNYYKGRAASHFMDILGYDAMCLGNHEFDDGVSGLVKPFLDDVTVPVLACNIDMRLSPELAKHVHNFTVLNVSGEAVGVVGFVTKETQFLADRAGIRNITFLEPIPCIQAVVDDLVRLGIDKIIALGHSGFDYSKKVAREVIGVDVVVDGHTNTFLYNGDPPSTEKPKGPYPVLINQESGHIVLVYQAYAYGKYLGNADVTFNDAGDVIKWSGNPILLDGSWQEDPTVLDEVNKWSKPLKALYEKRVGESYVDLQGGHVCELTECNMGNLITDAILYTVQPGPTSRGWSDVTMAWINGGAIRGPVKAGVLTVADMTSAMPIHDVLQIVRVTGSTLSLVLEHSVTSQSSTQGHFLQISGIKVKYDMCQPEGSRVRDVTVVCSDCDVPHYVAVSDDVSYNVLTTTYLAGGGDGFSVLHDNILETRDIDRVVDEIVFEYVRRRSPITPGLEGRISFIRTPRDCSQKSHSEDNQ